MTLRVRPVAGVPAAKRRTWANVGAVVAVAVLAAACGDDADVDPAADVDRSADDGVVVTDSSNTEAAKTTPSTSAAPPPTTPPAGTSAAPDPPDDGDDGPLYGRVDAELPAKLLQSGYDGPFFMINLIDFREQAEYADGRATDLTGVEANNLYGATGVQVLLEGGMRPAVRGDVVADPSAPTVPAWDQVAIARYPSYQDFFTMASDPVFQEGVEHKDAGVLTTTAIVSLRVANAPLAAELPRSEDPVVLFELFSHDGIGTTDRPEALQTYLDGLGLLATGGGGVALGTYEVQGAMIGDGREWDEAHLWWFSDRAQLEALLADPKLGDLARARNAALLDHYRLVLDGVQVEPLGREP